MQIYHLVPTSYWNTWPTQQPFLPAAYAHDGFIHCTAGDALMLKVANNWYQSHPGTYVVLVIDTELLTSELRWEQPADHLAPLFPHIYGPINQEAIVAIRAVQRAPDGEFLAF